MDFDYALKQYKKIKGQIISCKLNICEELESQGISSPKLDGMPNQPRNPFNSPILNNIIRIQELEQKLVDLETSKECLRNDLEKFLSYIDDHKMMYVCECRIFTDFEWQRIASTIDKSYSYTRQLYYDGISIMRKIKY